jgi:hypothetical protein
MPLVQIKSIFSHLVPPLDSQLVEQLVGEFRSLEKRFILGDWEPAELDGGQFAEVLSRILYHVDSGNLDRSRAVDHCLMYVEDFNSRNVHLVTPRHDALHMARVLRTVYKFRNQRGAVHVSPNYKANHMDARLMLECVRWCFGELLRQFWQGSKEDVARVIREILQFDVPCVGRYGESLLVQRIDLTAEEEVLILLHYSGESGMSRSELGRAAKCSAAGVSNTLKKLTSPQCRQIVELETGNYRLTDLGEKRLREELPDKLLL